MRIIQGFTNIKAYDSGKITLILDNIDDIWHFYNILCKGDLLQIKVSRKVIHESNNGTKSSSKKSFKVILKCENIEYDTSGEEIRINGKNVGESEYLSVGQFQSAIISKGIQFSIIKKSWDPFVLDKIKEASDPGLTSDLACLLMEEGVSHLYLVSSNLTTLKAKVDVNIPKKRKGPSNHEKSLIKFFTNTLDSILKYIDFSIVKCVVVGSPGFVKDQFNQFLLEKTTADKTYEVISKNMLKFIYTHTSCGYKQALNEIFSKSEVLVQIKNTKASEEIILMNRYNETLGKDYERIIFGIKQIEFAIESRAVDFLLVTDDYLRRIGAHNRKKLQVFLDKAEHDGSTVRTMSSMLPSGEKINNLGGITAVVKYKLQELDDIEYDQVEEVKTDIEDDDIANLDELINDNDNNQDDEEEDN